MIETSDPGTTFAKANAQAHDGQISVWISEEAFLGGGPTELLTQCWGNLLDFGDLRLEDFSLNQELVEKLTVQPVSRKPTLSRLREAMQVPGNQPLLGTVLKESNYLSPQARGELTARYAASGVHIVKEDETYTPVNSQVLRDVEAIQSCLGQARALYVPNLSGCSLERSFLEDIGQSGIRVAMINIWITGWNWITEIRRRLPGIDIWFHRVGYESLAPSLGMIPFLRCSRLAGAAFVHVGTPFLGSESEIARTAKRIAALNDHSMDGSSTPPIPVFSKTTTETVGELVHRFGPDLCAMACGEFRENRRIIWDRVRAWAKKAQSGAQP